MSPLTQCRRHTHVVVGCGVQWRVVTTVVAFLFLITPTMLCAMPMTSMNMAEHECCKHMRNVDDCSKANMDSCCVTVPMNTGLVLPELTSKAVVSSPIEADVAIFNVFEAAPVFGPLIGPRTFESPPLPAAAQVQVLRI